MIVVDASAVIEILLQSPLGGRVKSAVTATEQSIHVPEVHDLEILQAFRRLVLLKRVDVDRASEAVEDFGDLPLNRHGHALLRPRVWELRAGLSAYDAAYVALAEALDAPCITCDRRLASSTGHDAEIRLVR